MRGPFGPVMGKYPSSDGGSNGNNDIIKHNRKCKDLVFLVIFIAFWVAMIVNSSIGFNQGNPLRLNYGLDYKGNLCGEKHGDFDLRELELRYWLNPNQVYQTGLKDSKFQLSNARSICLMDCPIPSEDSLDWVCDYPEGDINLSLEHWKDRNYDYFADLTPQLRNTSLKLQGPCYPVIFPSVNVYWTCQFIARASNVSLTHWEEMGGVKVIEDIAIDKSIHRSINSRSSVLKRYVADVGKAWPVLLVCGGFLPLFLSIIWLLMIRHFVAGMPYITLILFNILIISVTMFYYLKAGWIGNDAVSPIIGEHDSYYHVSAREVNHLHAAAVLMTVLMIIAFLCSIAMARRILMATSVLKASSVASYYWARDAEIQLLPVFSSMKCLVQYSLGSIALGSLIVSFFESIRCILEAICRKMKQITSYGHGHGGSWAGKTMMYCVRCIGWIIRCVNRNAYIMIAITGKGFFKSSEIATELIMSNIVRIGKVNVIGDVILFIGKLCVSLSSALFAFLMLDTHKYKSAHNKISSPLFPVLVCWGFGYIIASLFFGVVEMSIDTIILSFCKDSDEHQGNAQYAPPLLIQTLNDQNEMQTLTQNSEE
ncbi:hypothetical protein RD792_006764 [Penstemon davidsonii]|uniref:Choline transporter-like protein n=1 Tax=Penstemon davidsonii TaxID=160366 RepID=A0ABR0DCE1_9LAMI|nr:hypothetical protein RD792_006764 [Penstemon davidsonii]